MHDEVKQGYAAIGQQRIGLRDSDAVVKGKEDQGGSERHQEEVQRGWLFGAVHVRQGCHHHGLLYLPMGGVAIRIEGPQKGEGEDHDATQAEQGSLAQLGTGLEEMACAIACRHGRDQGE